MNGKALLLDRDGTVIVEKGYLSDPEEVELVPGVADNIRKARLDGYIILIVSNQGAIGLGHVTESQNAAVLHAMLNLLHIEGARVEDFYYCPHHPDLECYCRRPNPGLIYQAISEWSIDPRRSWLVGDRDTDIAAADRVYGLNSHRVVRNKRWKLPYL